MLEISKNTQIKSPTGGLIIGRIKRAVVGDKYDLSLVFTGSALSKKINLKYRKKNHPTNILSFPLSKDSGEIFMDLMTIRKEAKKYKIKQKTYFLYIFIHGLLHLSGINHGRKMDLLEKKFLKKFRIRY